MSPLARWHLSREELGELRTLEFRPMRRNGDIPVNVTLVFEGKKWIVATKAYWFFAATSIVAK